MGGMTGGSSVGTYFREATRPLIVIDVLHPFSCARHFSIQSRLKPGSLSSVEPVRRRSWTVNGSSGSPSFLACSTTA